MAATRIGKYKIIEQIGKGGMGVVYKALDPDLDREVAIKVVLDRVLENQEVRARFIREAKTAGKLNHENISTIHELGEMDGKVYIVMEFLHGMTIREKIDTKAAASLRIKLEIAKQICWGLQFAHDHDVVHRDIKPDNVLLLRDDRVKIIDFGIAKPDTRTFPTLPADEQYNLTDPDTAIGTPWYMSPEQIKGEPVDRRSDIFSLGILLYEFFTFKKPFDGDRTTVKYKILHTDPEPIDVTQSGLVPSLESLLSRCLQKEPDARYANCSEISKEIDAILKEVSERERMTKLYEEADALVEDNKIRDAIKKYESIVSRDANQTTAETRIKTLKRMLLDQLTREVYLGQIEGRNILNYKVIERLGKGGMGVVYKAEDNVLRTTVALKFLSDELSESEEAKARFLKEAQSAASLSHPNVCDILGIHETEEGLTFLSMRFCEGKNLAEKIATEVMSVEQCLHIAEQIAAGLAKAHENKIIHRDIKPGNIIVAPDGHARIVDFGIARLMGSTRITQSGRALGTIHYMSPEHLRGEEDERTDIWALGVVLYQMLTQTLPFPGDNEATIMHGITMREPDPLETLRPDVPATVAGVVNKAIKKDLDERYASMDAFRAAIAAARKELLDDDEMQRATREVVTRLLDVAKLLEAKSDYEAAVTKINEALAIDPGNPKAIRAKQDLDTVIATRARDVQPPRREAAPAPQDDDRTQTIAHATPPILDEETVVITKEPAPAASASEQPTAPKQSRPSRRASAPPSSRTSKRPLVFGALGLAVAIIAVLAVTRPWDGDGGTPKENTQDTAANVPTATRPPADPPGDQPAAALVQSARDAQDEMNKSKSGITAADAGTFPSVQALFTQAADAEQAAIAALGNEQYEEAASKFGSADGLYRQAAKQIDTEKQNAVAAKNERDEIARLSQEAEARRDDMQIARRDARSVGSQTDAAGLDRQASQLVENADRMFAAGGRENLVSAARTYTEATGLFNQARDAAGAKPPPTNPRKPAAVSARAAMESAKGALAGFTTEMTARSAKYAEAGAAEDAGRNAFNAGDFDAARTSFQSATALYGDAVTQINANKAAYQREQAQQEVTTVVDRFFRSLSDGDVDVFASILGLKGAESENWSKLLDNIVSVSGQKSEIKVGDDNKSANAEVNVLIKYQDRGRTRDFPVRQKWELELVGDRWTVTRVEYL